MLLCPRISCAVTVKQSTELMGLFAPPVRYETFQNGVLLFGLACASNPPHGTQQRNLPFFMLLPAIHRRASKTITQRESKMGHATRLQRFFCLLSHVDGKRKRSQDQIAHEKSQGKAHEQMHTDDSDFCAPVARISKEGASLPQSARRGA